MLPDVTLRNVTRDDVDRIAWWLEDPDISSRWFGHYGCGDPVHRAYEPQHMIEASQWEWDRVFNDPHRLTYSIHNEIQEHIGECQLLLDGRRGAEMSLLIGRKDQWHHGYGTATVMILLDKVFDTLGLSRGWVTIPEDNAPALGLFRKLGFTPESTRELCERPDGAPYNATILGMDAASYLAHRQESMPAVTISGLPGSSAEAIGDEVARITGSRFIDGPISEELQQRLRCSAGELESMEASYRSFWTRLLSAIALPMGWSAAYDAGHYWFRPDPSLEQDLLEDHVSKKKYLVALAGVVKKLTVSGNVVLQGHGCHAFIPTTVESLKVFVSASPELRAQRIADSLGVGLEEADRMRKRSDRDTLSTLKNLHGIDLLDPAQYDLIVNLDRSSTEAAAGMVVGALKALAVSSAPSVEAPAAIALSAV